MNNASSRSHAIFTIKFTQVRFAFNETHRIFKFLIKAELPGGGWEFWGGNVLLGPWNPSPIPELFQLNLACENIRFSSLFAARDVSREERRSSARNVHSGEERGETDVFAG